MKIGFLSLGCPKNLVDGEVMLGIARDAGHEIITDASAADVLVVNTCAFIDSAKQESIDAILEMAALKRDGRCSRLVVTGCLAERYRDELKKEIPEIDVTLGTGEVEGIVDARRWSGRSVVRSSGRPVRCMGFRAKRWRRSAAILHWNVEQPADRATERPNDRATERPTDRTTEQSADRTTERPVPATSTTPTLRAC